MTHLERGIIFLSYCYSERIIYAACDLSNFCMNLLRKEVTAVSKRLGKMDIVVERNVQFRNHVDQWCKPNCNPHDRNELRGVSGCLSVCPFVYRYQKFGFIKRVAKG